MRDFWAMMKEDQPPLPRSRSEAVDSLREWIVDRVLDQVPDWPERVDRLDYLRHCGTPYERRVIALRCLGELSEPGGPDRACRAVALVGGLDELAGELLDEMRRERDA